MIRSRGSVPMAENMSAYLATCSADLFEEPVFIFRYSQKDRYKSSAYRRLERASGYREMSLRTRSARASSCTGLDDHARQRGFDLEAMVSYLLKNIHAVSANKTTVAIHREELLISVFLAMSGILISMLC